MDLDSVLSKARNCSQASLLNVFSTVVTAIWPVLTEDVCSLDKIDSIKKEVRKALLDLPEVNKKVPPKAPPRKKAPPPAKAKATSAIPLSTRFALFWPSVDDRSISVKDAVVNDLPAFISKAADVFDITIPPFSQSLPIPANSVYDVVLDETAQEKLKRALDETLIDHYFKRKTNRIVPLKVAETGTKEVRISPLGDAMCQRLGIMIHSLKKATGPKSSLESVKEAILACALGESEIALLADLVPNKNDPCHRRRYEQWEEMIQACQRAKDDYGTLQEAEEFIQFLGAIPCLHERLACMFIASSFDRVMCQLVEDLEFLCHTMDLIAANRDLCFAWQLFLRLGNALNEGTNRGGQRKFKFSALRRAMDVRGNEGICFVTYYAAQVGHVFNTAQWKALSKAKEIGPLHTYASAKNALNTLMIILGHPGEDAEQRPPAIMDAETKLGYQDKFVTEMQKFAEGHRKEGMRLTALLTQFVCKYVTLAYFFSDPSSFLPLEDGLDGDADSEESPARDIFIRLAYFFAIVQSKSVDAKVIEMADKRPCDSIETVAGTPEAVDSKAEMQWKQLRDETMSDLHTPTGRSTPLLMTMPMMPSRKIDDVENIPAANDATIRKSDKCDAFKQLTNQDDLEIAKRDVTIAQSANPEITSSTSIKRASNSSSAKQVLAESIKEVKQSGKRSLEDSEEVSSKSELRTLKPSRSKVLELKPMSGSATISKETKNHIRVASRDETNRFAAPTRAMPGSSIHGRPPLGRSRFANSRLNNEPLPANAFDSIKAQLHKVPKTELLAPRPKQGPRRNRNSIEATFSFARNL